MKGIIQIAGIIDEAEAQMLLRCGVDWLGFPLRLAFHREDLAEADAAGIIRSLRSRNCCVLITYLSKADEIAALCRALGTSRVQLHGEIAVIELEALKISSPGLFVMKSLVIGKNDTSKLKETLAEFSPWVDAFITDTFDPETGACGATGKTHDWQISRELVEFSPRPVILAGGLKPDNVSLAIKTVRPAGVDAHTGVEGPDGRKREDLVRDFVARAREAFF